MLIECAACPECFVYQDSVESNCNLCLAPATTVATTTATLLPTTQFLSTSNLLFSSIASTVYAFNLTVKSHTDVAALNTYSSVAGNLDISSYSGASITATSIKSLGASFWFRNNGETNNAIFNTLTWINGNFVVDSDNALHSMSINRLAFVGGNFQLTNSPNLLAVTLQSLLSVGGSFAVSQLSGLEVFSAPVLTSVGGDFTLSATDLQAINLPKLVTVLGDFDVVSNTAVWSLSAALLNLVVGAFNVHNDGALTFVSFPSLAEIEGGALICSNSAGFLIPAGLSALLTAAEGSGENVVAFDGNTACP